MNDENVVETWNSGGSMNRVRELIKIIATRCHIIKLKLVAAREFLAPGA